MNKFKYIITIFAVLLFFSCDVALDEYEPDAGDADFSVFVALGNSLTAGFTDGELFRDGQLNSTSNILAGQLMHVGLNEFRQPLMKDNVGFGGRLVLAVHGQSLLPVYLDAEPDPLNFQNIFADEGPFHNVGVPGAKTQHLLIPGYGTMNPYYNRFSSDAQTASIINDAMILNPTFFSLWIGNNDILDFALSGGEGSGITPVEDFERDYTTILDKLKQINAKGVVANLPDMASIPFFTTLPYNPIDLPHQNLVDILNDAYQAVPHISFELGKNALIVEDMSTEYAPFFFRQLYEGEMVLLFALEKLNDPEIRWGIEVPLPAQYYLSLDQIKEIHAAVDAYNAVILKLANEYDLAHTDVNSLLNHAKTGIYFDGIEFTTGFISGGAFSIDGIHMSARGYAIVANEMIAAINQKYNASIPKALVGQFSGIIFP